MRAQLWLTCLVYLEPQRKAQELWIEMCFLKHAKTLKLEIPERSHKLHAAVINFLKKIYQEACFRWGRGAYHYAYAIHPLWMYSVWSKRAQTKHMGERETHTYTHTHWEFISHFQHEEMFAR